jgi:uncharacterized protein YqjF (DUF2071 family)
VKEVSVIDRIAATRRPDGRSVMRQRWHHLLFLHWQVPVAALRERVPRGLTIDTFEGNAYLGLIPFTITGVRPVGIPPLGGVSAFHEVNVRTYVHRNGADPGVWFFSLDAASLLAVVGARIAYRLPYFYSRMSMARREGERCTFEYASHRRWSSKPAGCRLRYGFAGIPGPAPLGTLEHFLIERYILYAAAGKRLYQARVHHAPYPLQQGCVEDLEESLCAASGIARPASAPLCHYASSLDVEVFAPRAIQ